jgi:hypothetical protein
MIRAKLGHPAMAQERIGVRRLGETGKIFKVAFLQ